MRNEVLGNLLRGVIDVDYSVIWVCEECIEVNFVR